MFPSGGLVASWEPTRASSLLMSSNSLMVSTDIGDTANVGWIGFHIEVFLRKILWDSAPFQYILQMKRLVDIQIIQSHLLMNCLF